MEAQEAMKDSFLGTFSLGCLPSLRIAAGLGASSGGQASRSFACAEDAVYFTDV